jgi:hypothetical protein
VPRITPALVAAWVMVGDAESSSRRTSRPRHFRFRETEVEHLDAPEAASMTLPGLRSRWTTPLSCAASTPAAICGRSRAPRRAAAARAEPLRERLARDELEHQVALAADFFEAVDRRDVRVVSDASSRASRSKRATRSGRS